MCSNYRPFTQSDRLLKFFSVVRETDQLPGDVCSPGLAPAICSSSGRPPERR